MKKKQISEIGVSKKAIEFWELFNFILSTEEQDTFYKNFKNKSRREIDTEIFKKREEKLLNNKYNNYDEFLEFFNKNKKLALELLFQQPIKDSMIELITSSPKQLYYIHSKKPNIWFMECILYL